MQQAPGAGTSEPALPAICQVNALVLAIEVVAMVMPH